MKINRLFTDSIIIVLSIITLTTIYVTLEWFFPQFGTYKIILDLFIGISFIIYGWLLKRWFSLKIPEKKEFTIIHFLKISLPILGLVIIFTLIVSLSSLSQISLLVALDYSLLYIYQIIMVSTLVGILLFQFIEKNLGVIFFKETIEDEKNALGTELMDKQLRYAFRKQWNIGMVLLWFSIMVANLLVFLTYPSIPANDVQYSLQYLSFTFPNFNFAFNSETGFYQEFFSSVAIPSSTLLNWKLIQSLMCLIFAGLLVLLIYLPKQKKIVESYSEEEKRITNNIPSTKTTSDTLGEEDQIIENFDDIDQDILAYKILSPSKTEEYLPSNIIKPYPRRRFSNLMNKMKNSDIIPVMNLSVLNLVLGLFIVIVFSSFGIITNVSNDLFSDLYAQLSHLYWAGLVEEISFRFLLFSVPLFIIYGFVFLFIFTIKKFFLSSKEEKELSRLALWIKSRSPTNPLLYLTGRWGKLRFLDIIVLLISSFGFGYAHYQFSPDYWGTWKIFQAGIAGIIFGYAYYKYGFHAAIILHTVNDFVLGMLTTPNLGLLLNGGIIFVFIIITGTVFSVKLVINALSVSFKFINTILKRGQSTTDISK